MFASFRCSHRDLLLIEYFLPFQRSPWSDPDPPGPAVKHLLTTFNSLDAAATYLFHAIRSSVIRKNLFFRHLALPSAFVEHLGQFRKVTWVEGCLQLQYIDSRAIPPFAFVESFAQIGALSCRSTVFGNAGALDDDFLRKCSEVGFLKTKI